MSGYINFRKILLPALLLLFCMSARAQETEESMKEKAELLFSKEQYVEATSYYLRLLALSPRSYDYNFRYGTCLLFNSYKKQDAFKYLNYSVTDANIDVQAFYFLGKAYHLNYQFNEAIKNFDLYKQKTAGKPKAAYEVDRQIEMCQNGKRLLTTITDIIVLEKKEYDKAEFFRLYNLENIGGDLIVAATYQSKVDKKKGHVPLVHIGADAKSFYYSSYGDNDTGQKDIYVRKKLPDNSWSMPQLVNGNVNTKYDEDFPYMHPGGEYLYFSSKGHNSMGGYDIFRSKINPETNSFGPPENMDFAISSPDDDIFYVVDSLDQNAYFASARQSTNGKLFVYKVRVDRVPLQLAVIKGTFSSDINPENRKISISVTDFASGEKIGTFASNEKSSYLITLPKGGKYKYEMKVEGKQDVHTYIVNVPFFKEFHPLKQKIIEEKSEDRDVVRVIDLFNEAVDDPVGVLAEVIKNRSELNPNAAQFDLESLDQKRKDAEALAALGFEDGSPTAIVSKFEELESKKGQELKSTENLVNGALNKASDNLAEAQKLQDAARTEVNRAGTAETKQEKFELFESAKEKSDKAAELENEARILIAFSDSASAKLQKDKQSLQAIHAVTEEVRTAVKDDNIGDLKDIIGRNTAVITDASTSAPDPVDQLNDKKDEVRKQKNEAEKQRDNYTSSAQRTTSEIAKLKTDLAAAKAKDKPAIQSAIDAKERELSLMNDEAAYQDKKIAKFAADEKVVNDRISFLQGVTGTAPAKTTPAEVKSKLAEVDSKNNNTLANFINQQYEQLKKDPAVTSVTPGDEDPVVELSNKFNNDQQSVEDDNTLTAEAKSKKLADLDEQLLASIDGEIKDVEEKLQKDPGNQQAAAQKQALAVMKSEAEKRREDRALATQPVETTPAKELASLEPDYQSKMYEAAGNGVKQLGRQNDLDKDLIGKIDAELEKTAETIGKDPSDKSAISKQKALQQLKNEKQTQITKREEEIRKLNENQPVASTSPEKELLAVAPSYETEMAAVSGDPKSQLEKKNQLDNDLIAKIDGELLKVEEILGRSPSDAGALGKQKALNELKSEKQRDVTDRNKQLELLASNPVAIVTPETVLLKLNPEYDSEMAAVSGNDKPELEKQNALDKTLMEKIDTELEAVNAQSVKDPQNKELTAQKEALVTLRNQASERISDREEQIEKIESQSSASNIISPEYEKDNLMPDYDAKMSGIASGEPLAALEGRNEIDKELLSKIDDELAEIEGQLLRNPDNKEAAARQEALESLRTETTAIISSREAEIEKLKEQQLPQSDSLASVKEDLRPEYEANVKRILQNTPEGDEQVLALLKEDQALLEDINREIEKTDAQVLKDPSNAQLTEKLETLKEAQAIQEGTVNEKQADLVAKTGGSIDKKELLKKTAPKYQPAESGQELSSSAAEAEIVKEQELQKTLQKQMTANQKKLEKGFDPEIAAENKVLSDLIEESGMRIEQLKNPGAASDIALAAINEDLGSDAEFLMRKDPQTVDDAKRMLTELKEYENALNSNLEEIRTDAAPEDLQVIEEKLRAVRKRIGIVEADLDAMENYVVPVTQNVKSETELLALTNREEALRNQLSTPGISNTEKKSVQKELTSVTKEKTAREKEVLEARNASVNNSLTEASSALKTIGGGSDLAANVLSDADEVVNTPEKNTPEAQREQLRDKQEKLTLIKEATNYIQTEKAYTEQNVIIQNEESLQNQKRRFLIEIGQLEATGTKLSEDPSKGAELQEVQNKQKTLRDAVAKIDSMIEALGESKTTASFTEELQTPVTYEKELETAGKPVYQSLVRQYTEVKESERQLRQIEKEKTGLRSEIAKESDPEKRSAKINALIEMEQREKTLQQKLNEQRSALESAIRRSGEDPEVVMNMLARDVPYQEAKTVIADVAPEYRSGFTLVARPETVRKENLPVGTKAPSGLVYRVQVGAYAKPLPENLFTEFTPVTGEKLNNGITRYLAGYFGNKPKASEAQRAIRALGYSDAFLVAYCDGERISLAEAKRLEEAGLCIAKTQDSLIMEIVANHIATLPADSVAKLMPVIKKSDYNKAPGAVPAEAVEDRQGLFFTVQVGVYNRPATRDQLRGIDPLITKRLPNGQIRYSSGVFRSPEAARPKRMEAVTRGITDAFITAYFKGERISLSDARRILEEQGESVLENDSVTVNKPELFEEARIYASERPVVVPVSSQPVQLVSSRTYDVYPEAELNRLNTSGTFFYDAGDQHIKSIVYSSAGALPDLTGVSESIDTVFQKSEIGSTFEPKLPSVVAEWERSGIEGAFADWLIRSSGEHSALITETGIQVRFENVEPSEREKLIALLQNFGASLVRLEEE